MVTSPNGPETGTVESVTLGYTALKTFDNRRVILPNSVMANQTTANFISADPRVMASVPITIHLQSRVAQAREVLLELAAAHPAAEEVVSCPDKRRTRRCYTHAPCLVQGHRGSR